MKRIVLIIIGICLLFSSCREEHISTINTLVKDLFCFKAGSEWTYYDSVSQKTQKMAVTNYEILKFAPMPKGGRKAYDFAEYIKIKGHFLTNFEVRIISQGEEIDYDNTADFRGSYSTNLPLRFTCDQNNNFNCPDTYLAEYDVDGIVYKDVYIFNMNELSYSNENLLFYVAKNIGLIRMMKVDEFDWVLTDKNIQQ